MIIKLKVENYKSIEKAELDFGRINVLIGKNGTGKTTLISTIDLLKNIASGANINSVINEIAPLSEFFNANTGSNLANFEVTVQSKQNNIYVYSFSICFGKPPTSSQDSQENRYYFFKESLLAKKTDGASESVFRRDANEIDTIKVGVDERSIPQRINGSVSALSSYAQRQAQEVAGLLSDYSIIWMERGSFISSSLQFANDLDFSTIDGVAVGLYLKDQLLYKEAMGIISQIIPGFVEPSINRLPIGPDDNGGHSEHLGFVVTWKDGKYVEKRTFSSNVLSGGNSRVIYLILSLYYSEAKTCFVAEEIENGMHLGRISNLMDKIKMIGKNHKIQLFLTTHNYLILDDLLPKEVILARLGSSGSEYIRLSEASEYADIKEDLGRDPTSREMAESGLLFS